MKDKDWIYRDKFGEENRLSGGGFRVRFCGREFILAVDEHGFRMSNYPRGRWVDLHEMTQNFSPPGTVLPEVSFADGKLVISVEGRIDRQCGKLLCRPDVERHGNRFIVPFVTVSVDPVEMMDEIDRQMEQPAIPQERGGRGGR